MVIAITPPNKPSFSVCADLVCDEWDEQPGLCISSEDLHELDRHRAHLDVIEELLFLFDDPIVRVRRLEKDGFSYRIQ